MRRLITSKQLAIGSLTFAIIIAAGIVSYRAVDYTFALIEAGQMKANVPASSTPATQPDAPAKPDAPASTDDNGLPPSVTSGPCIEKDGSWRNWPHPNVPMLSPKCAE